jgi:hypothetical protein
MLKASARRSFHGPLHAAPPASARPRPAPARPLELVPSPSASSLGRAVLRAAREETPGSCERERILASVLSALVRLTSDPR